MPTTKVVLKVDEVSHDRNISVKSGLQTSSTITSTFSVMEHHGHPKDDTTHNFFSNYKSFMLGFSTNVSFVIDLLGR